MAAPFWILGIEAKLKPRKWWNILHWTPILFYPKRYQRPLTVALWLLIVAIFLQISIGWASRISDPSLLV